MSALRPFRLLSPRLVYVSRRTYASRTAIKIPAVAPSIPVIDHCPSPTCQCRPMPPDLDIDREKDLNGSMPNYAEQLVICSGKSDWQSRIEDEEGADGELVRSVKGLMGQGGKLSDPYHNVMITNSSFPPTSSSTQESATSAYLLPSFTYIPALPTAPTSVEAFLKAFALPSGLHQAHKILPIEQQNTLKRQPELQRSFVDARKVNEILILICGHGGRDSRCGVLGPLLRDEFEEKLQRQGVALLHDALLAPDTSDARTSVPAARVGLISHIGGHRWAGNVIIYIPPSFSSNILAGKGIWYGRVGPQHVEGIVAETVVKGQVIKELFRGAIGQGGETVRL
ncbi:hypothetical protein LTR08_001095 [Meristemomyces frigidus]|nr:hypothetical protein LTR08_001095 [Meristemomyces frigidus]